MKVWTEKTMNSQAGKELFISNGIAGLQCLNLLCDTPPPHRKGFSNPRHLRGRAGAVCTWVYYMCCLTCCRQLAQWDRGWRSWHWKPIFVHNSPTNNPHLKSRPLASLCNAYPYFQDNRPVMEARHPSLLLNLSHCIYLLLMPIFGPLLISFL